MKLCIRCGENPTGRGRSGRELLVCDICRVANRRGRLGVDMEFRRRHKKTSCEHCGFIAINPCQLDVDHIDGNRDNNDPSNFRTLCANCHRLKTITEKDNLWHEKDPAPSPQLRLVG